MIAYGFSAVGFEGLDGYLHTGSIEKSSSGLYPAPVSSYLMSESFGLHAVYLQVLLGSVLISIGHSAGAASATRCAVPSVRARCAGKSRGSRPRTKQKLSCKVRPQAKLLLREEVDDTHRLPTLTRIEA